jgi:hypothetical protein
MNGPARYLKPNPNLPKGAPSAVADLFARLAKDLTAMDNEVKISGVDQWELMYQKLLEAKDCGVRAVLDL